MEIIEWLNVNYGFSSIILSAVGLLISTIAIVISIKTAKLPYKKKIGLVMTYNYLFPAGVIAEIEVQALNLGNRPVRMKKLGLGIKMNGSMSFLCKIDNINTPALLNPTEEMNYVYDIEDFKKILSENKGYKMLYMYAKDNEGKEYIKKIKRINKMRKRF